MDNFQENNNQGNFQIETTTISAKEFVFKYLHYWWLFIITLAVTIVPAWLYLRYTNPTYSVSSTLLIKNDNTNRSGGALKSQDMFEDIALFQSNTNKQNEILILVSRTMMERVVKSLGLQKEYMVVGTVKTKDLYPDQPFDLDIVTFADSSKSFSLNIHFSEDWSTFNLKGKPEQYPVNKAVQLPEGLIKLNIKSSPYRQQIYRDFIVIWRPVQEAATLYAGNLEVKPANDMANVLSLSFIHENPVFASTVLNELMYQYNNAAIEDKNEMNRKILTFIRERLRLVDNQLDSVEGNLQAYRTRRQVINLTAQSEMYFGNMTQLNDNLRQQEVQLQVAGLIEDYLKQPSNHLSLVPSTLGLTDPTLIQLTNAYNGLVVERLKELQTGATPENPIVKNLDKSINEARLKMLQNLANIKNVYRNTINIINAQNGSLKKEITSIPERERETKERAREQEIKQNLYLYLMQKKEESEIAQASTIANSRILDTALPVSKLVNPIPFKVYGIALLAGLLLPVLIIYGRDLLNDKVTTKLDITKVTNAPILGEIGHSEEDKVLLFPNNSRTIVAEQMRILRSNLRFVLGEKFESPTILVTSSFSGEGKSFISTNLGATLAVSGKRTVILEFDLRKPKILAGLGLPKGQGLTNYLIGGAQLDQLAQQVPQVDNLFVIPCGPVPPNPSEILLTPKIDDLFAWLKEKFEVIVIDTAPVGLVSDAFTLSRYADASIYVVRQRYTFKRQLSFIEEMNKQKRLPKMGLLVNDVLVHGGSGYYGYGGRYGYGYGYGYGESYFDTEKKKKKGLFGRIKGVSS